METRLDQYLYDLVSLPGLAGHEGAVFQYMATEFSRQGFQLSTDVHGNCIAKIEGRSNAFPIMIFAHMDSLGFIVKFIEENGYLRLERLGGIPEKVLPAEKVLITAQNGETVPGVIGMKAHHITAPEEKYKVLPYQELFVDIGAKTRQEVLDLGIDIGSPVVYQPSYTRLLNGRIQATFIDDRGGCAVLLELGRRLSGIQPHFDVYLVGTVQEEYNLRGAMMAARSVHPKVAIGIDCAPAADTPDLKGTGEAVLGNGPVMTLYNFHGRGTLNGTIAHPALVRLIQEAGALSAIRCQKAAYVGALTDMAYLQLEEGGVIGIDMGFPMRYAHTPSEVTDVNDMEQLVALLIKTISLIDGETKWHR